MLTSYLFLSHIFQKVSMPSASTGANGRVDLRLERVATKMARRAAKDQEKLAKMQEKCEKKAARLAAKWAAKSGAQNADQGSSSSAAAAASSSQEQRAPQRFDARARFVADLTLPDGTRIAPLTEVTKIWELENSSNSAWPAGVHLVPVGGENMHLSVDKQALMLPPCAPGDRVAATVELRMPVKPGRYTQYFRLAYENGVRFGDPLWVDVNVSDDADGDVAAAIAACAQSSQQSGLEEKQPQVASSAASVSESTSQDLSTQSANVPSNLAQSMSSIVGSVLRAPGLANLVGNALNSFIMPQPSVQSAAPVSAAPQDQSAAPQDQSAAPVNQAASDHQQQPASAEANANAQPEQYAAEVDLIVSLGFEDRDVIRRALRDAQGNVDNALDQMLNQM
jgi:hypothetical protein